MKDSKKQAPAAQERLTVEDGAIEHAPRMIDAKKAGAAPKGSPDGLPRRPMFRDRQPGEAG